MSTTAPVTDEILHCARHPNTETVLRCGRCETPICPKCLVPTPVGARCPTCAQVKRFALLVKPRELALSVLYGISAAAVGTLILFATPLAILGLLGQALLGFLTGEAVSIGANRKRAKELGPVALVCLFVGYWLGIVLLTLYRVGFANFAPGMLSAPFLVLQAQPFLLLGLLLGALLAWMRVR
jgi:hypothetical protein